MSILVVFTGGTIGSAKNGDWVMLDSSTKNKLISEYKKTNNDDVIMFETVTPFEMHSENLSADKLTKLISFLCEKEKEDYDGIIVTHGTDTLQYSAAAAFYCLNAKKPVVFVSSNYPLENEKANGQINFDAAVKFIRESNSGGVYISYSNDKVTADIHFANEVLSYPELSDKIFSVGTPPYSYKNKTITKNQNAELVNSGMSLGAIKFCDNPGILNLRVTPFEQYNYNPTHYNAVFLSPYHSGTLNTESKKFRTFCEDCMRKKVYLLLPDVPKDSAYDSMREYEELGIKVLKEKAIIPLFVLVWIAVSLNKNIVEFLLDFYL